MDYSLIIFFGVAILIFGGTILVMISEKTSMNFFGRNIKKGWTSLNVGH